VAVSDGFDVAIVGAGPAGLSAALLLGRCCRRVVVCDVGRPRNGRSAVHGFLTRDGTDPDVLRRMGREELLRYPTVSIREAEVVDGRRDERGFTLALAGGGEVAARKLLLATGIIDDLPPIPGLAALWGRRAFPCPYCDAYEFKESRIGVLGHGDGALGLCRALSCYTRDVMLFCGGPTEMATHEEEALVTRKIRIECADVEGVDDLANSVRVRLAGPPAVERDVLFVDTRQHQRSPLVAKLGCRINDKGIVETGLHESTNVPGLYVAGDASDNVQFAIVAAAEGAEAAFEINRALVREAFSAHA
jgi:thioredoxin reductase